MKTFLKTAALAALLIVGTGCVNTNKHVYDGDALPVLIPWWK